MSVIPPSPIKKGPFKLFRSKQPAVSQVSGPATKGSFLYTKKESDHHGIQVLPNLLRPLSTANPSTSASTILYSSTVDDVNEDSFSDESMRNRSATLPTQLPSEKKESGAKFERPSSHCLAPLAARSPLVHIECLAGGRHLQRRSEALLLTAELWPLPGDRPLPGFQSSTAAILTGLETLEGFVERLRRTLSPHVTSNKQKEMMECVRGISSRACALTQLSYDSILALCPPSTDPVLVDRIGMIAASDQVEVALFRITQYLEDLWTGECQVDTSGDVVLWCCGELSSALTSLVVACRLPPDVLLTTPEPPSSALIRFCVSSVRAAAQALITGLSLWIPQVVLTRSSPGHTSPALETLRGRVSSMVDAVQCSSQALLGVALDPALMGTPMPLPQSAKAVRASVCGSCLTVSSACVQLLSAVDRLQRSSSDSVESAVHQRCFNCIQAVTEAVHSFQRTLWAIRGN